MAQRLPIPGGDDNTWGNILNAYLEVSHNTDGTLLGSAIATAGGEMVANKGAASGYAGLNGSSLVPSAQLGTGTADTTKFLRGDGSWQVPPSSGGSSTLSGDTDVTITSPANNQVLTYNSGSSKWVNQAAPVISVAGKTGTVTLVEGDIANLTTDLNATEKTANKDTANGYAGLDSSGLLKTAELPSSVVTSSALGYLNALQNGVSTSGDQTANISAFFDACNTAGKAAYFPKGTYQCGSITKSYALNIFADPGTVIQTNNTSGTTWIFQGSLAGGTTALTGNATIRSQTLNVGAGNVPGGVTTGSLLLVGTATQINGDQSNRYCGQLVEVATANNGTGVITIQETLYRTFTTAESAYIQVVNSIGPVQIKGLKFTNPSNNNIGFVTIAYARDVDCEINGDGAQQPGVGYFSVYNFRFSGRAEHYKWNLGSSQFGYTFLAQGASTHGEVDTETINGSFGFQTSATNTAPGEPGDIIVRGINANSVNSAWGTHPAGWDITFDNVTTINAGYSDIEIYSPRTKVIGGMADTTGLVGLTTAGFGVYVSTNALSDIEIRGRTFKNIGTVGQHSAIHGDCAISDLRILDNVFDGVAGECVGFSAALTDFVLAGNTGRGWGKSNLSGSNYAYRFNQTLTRAQIHDNDWIVPDSADSNFTGAHFDVSETQVLVRNENWQGYASLGHGASVYSDAGGISYGTNWIDGMPTQKFVSVTASATPNFDPTAGRNQAITLNTNVTSSTLTSSYDSVVAGQDGTDLRLWITASTFTWTWPVNVIADSGNSLPTPSTSGTSVYQLIYNTSLSKWVITSAGSSPVTALTGQITLTPANDSTVGLLFQAPDAGYTTANFEQGKDSSGNTLWTRDSNGKIAIFKSGSQASILTGSQPGDAHARAQYNNDSIQLGPGNANLDTTISRPAAGVANINSALSVTGMTGATSASRYVGATASGAPASGTFAVGDFVIDQSGAVWICTSAGTPGTWVSTASAFPTNVSLSGSQQRVLSASHTGDAHPRIQFNNDSMQFGDGTNNVDTLFNRGGAGRVQAPAVQATGLSGSAGVSTGAFIGVVNNSAPTGGGATYNVGDWAVDSSNGSTWICTVSGAPGTWINSRGNTTPQSLWMPTNAKAETFPRAGARLSEAVSALSTGRLSVFAITLEAGVTISSITFVSNSTSAGTPANQWFCLLDTSLNVLRTTTDDTNTAWAANTAKTLNLSSSYTPTSRQAAYVGINVTATTPPTLTGYSEASFINGVAPIVSATSSSGLTNPASLGSTAGALSTASGFAWAYLS